MQFKLPTYAKQNMISYTFVRNQHKIKAACRGFPDGLPDRHLSDAFDLGKIAASCAIRIMLDLKFSNTNS